MVRNRYSSRASIRGLTTGCLTALCLLALGSCAKSDGDAPSLATASISSTQEKADTARIEHLVAMGQESVALTEWRPTAQTKGVILAVHGYGDYGPSTFADAADDWAKAGIATYAYDQRGFGRNPSNGDWPGHDALINDLSRIAGLVRDRHPDVPLALVGHSMGGGVVTAALGEGKVDVDKAILLAPALWGGDNLSPFLRSVAHTAHAFFPDKRWTGDGIVSIQASDNIEMLRRLGRDPLIVRNPSSREFVGLIRLMDRAVAAAPLVKTPILVAFGAKDEVLPEESVRDAYDQFAGPKRYEEIDTGWHLLLRDLRGEKVRNLVADFLLNKAS